MKKQSTLFAITTLALLMGSSVLHAKPDMEKISICHLDDEGRYKVLKVSAKAEGAHFNHGDFAPTESGACISVELVGEGVWLGDQFTANAAVRLKGPNSGKELYVGKHDLGVGGNRNESEFKHTNGVDYLLSVNYDGQTIRSTVTNSANNKEASASKSVAASGCEDTILLGIIDRRTTGSLQVSELTVNGDALAGVYSTTQNYAFWKISGVDMQNLSVEATVNNSPWDSNENDKVEIQLGCWNG